MTRLALHQTVRISAGEAATGEQSLVDRYDVGVIVDFPENGFCSVERSVLAGVESRVDDFPESALSIVESLPFEVEGFIEVLGNPVVMARALFRHNFTLGPSATLGGCRIVEFQIPRSLDEQGNQRYDVYAITLAKGSSYSCCKGDRVQLELV